MARTPEGTVKAAIRKYLDQLPQSCWFMPVSNGMGKHGKADIIGCYRGYHVEIEVKAPGKLHTLTPLQARNLQEVRAAGGCAIVTDNVEDVVLLIQRIDKRCCQTTLGRGAVGWGA